MYAMSYCTMTHFVFFLIPAALSTVHTVFSVYCSCLLNVDSLGVNGWTFSDVP